MKVIFIGSGNLATCLSAEMQRTGIKIAGVYSRTAEHAASLAAKLNCTGTNNMDAVPSDADLYVFALTDDALLEVISRMKPNNGLWVHTAGSLPMNIFEGYTERYGVFYPLQTFTGSRKPEMEEVPVFIEANNADDLKMLRKVAIAISGNVQELDYEKRAHLHLAAVFASNFSNHMYAIAAEILEEQGLSYKLLLPLINETAGKIKDLPPLKAQTGPAVRFDKTIMEKHISLLDNLDSQSIYKLVSQNIHNKKNTI